MVEVSVCKIEIWLIVHLNVLSLLSPYKKSP